MWRDEFYDETTSFAYEDGIFAFSDFLGTTAYTGNLDPDAEPPSLLGALHLWLYYDNGLTICPTYESFMMTLVLIIEDWLKHDRISVAGGRLWPFVDGTPVQLVNGGRDQLMVQNDSRLLIRREVYEQLKSTREAHDRDELFGLLNRIRHLKVPEVPQD